MGKTTVIALAAAAAGLLRGAALAADLAVVAASQSGPYTEAMDGFRKAIGQSFDFYDASRQEALPEDAHYLVLFGAKAAAGDYPPGTHVVYALAPLGGHRRPGWHEVSMLPAPEQAVSAYKALQPGLKRLAVFWSAYPGEGYLDELERAGVKLGVKIIRSRVKDPDFFPERLRSLVGKMDAFWIMPDPVLINQSSLMVLTNFSCANSVPFYAPTYALVLNGASASFSPDFYESGAAAARVIRAMEGGTDVPAVTYPDNAQLKVNATLAPKCGWPFSLK